MWATCFDSLGAASSGWPISRGQGEGAAVMEGQREEEGQGSGQGSKRGAGHDGLGGFKRRRLLCVLSRIPHTAPCQ